MTHFISILLAILVTLMLASPAGFSKEAKKSGPSKPKATQETKKPAPKSDKEKGGIQYSPPQPKKEQAKKPYLKHCADVVYIRGDLREKRASEDRWLVAHEGTPDYLYDHLKTGSGSDSVATIEFVNGSQVGINKGTELLIESESSAKDVTERSFARKITLKAGTLWAKVRKAEAEENLQFHTRGGVIGVKGTELIIDATGETTTVDVLEGSVDYTRGGKTTTIQEGTTLEAKTSGELKTTKMDKAELRKQKEKQFEELSRAVSIAGSIPG
ncbi:MAG: FecR domain-containing protein, partial [Armatimonadetes bacterium]|nr:FecR domain-containing protein [Armatimonadota bacterium]